MAKIISCRMTEPGSQAGKVGDQLERVLNETGAACRHLPMVSYPLPGFGQLNLILNGRAALHAASPAPSADRPARGASDNGHGGQTERLCSCHARSQVGRA